MTVKTFIERAIEGGWAGEFHIEKDNPYHEIDQINRDMWGVWFYWSERNSEKKLVEKSKEILLPSILLDPLAWRAVWNTEKGKCWACKGEKFQEDFFDKTKLDMDSPCGNCNQTGTDEYERPWVKNMHRMIDALAEGKTIEEFLLTL